MFFKSISLIIDDKESDGNFISAYLNKNFIPSIFYCYDSSKEWDDSHEKISGVRTIFQDLSLISTSSPNATDFDAATDTIQNLLDVNNGPWLLITWSTWAESESDSDFPKDLFNHLQNELPVALRPFDYITINKSIFTPGNDHNPVSEPTNESLTELHHLIEVKLSERHGLKYLIGWEQAAKKAVYSALTELTTIANGHIESNKVLHKILDNIASSATGKSTCPIALNSGASETLSDIIKDKIENQIPNNVDDFTKVIQNAQENRDLDMSGLSKWKEAINKAIHFDTSEKINRTHKPGMLYDVDSRVLNSQISSFPETFNSTEQLSKFKRKNFFEFLTEESSVKREVSTRSHLIFLDITPPCDHANNKAEWNKYIVGLLLNEQDSKFCKFIQTTRDETGNIRKRDEFGSRLINDNLILLPKFSNGSSITPVFRIVLNAKLVFSIPTNKTQTCLNGMQTLRIRENMLADIRSWFIKQATRPGVVELRD